MVRQSFSRIAGAAGIGFAATIVGINLIMVPAGLPVPGAGVAEAEAFFGTHGAVVGLGSAFAPLAWVLATVFGAGAVAVLWPAERRRGEAWSLVGFAGLTLQNLTFAGVIAARLALAAGSGADGGAGRGGLWALHNAVFTLNGTFLALAMLGLSVAGWRAGLIRPWHALLGLVAGALQFASASLASPIIGSAGPLGAIGLVGWLGWVVWIAVFGFILFRRPVSITRRAAGGADGGANHIRLPHE